MSQMLGEIILLSMTVKDDVTMMFIGVLNTLLQHREEQGRTDSYFIYILKTE